MRQYIEMVTEMAAITPPSLLYHISRAANRASILAHGIEPRAGSWTGSKWTAKVFFATNKNAAYELAYNIEDHRRDGPYCFFIVDPARIPKAKFYRDRDYPDGLWTRSHIPPEAIVAVNEIDDEYYESPEYLQFMGLDDDDGE